MPLADAIAAATDLGTKEGIKVAGWVFDGNTTRETYATVLKWITDGDPQMSSIEHEPGWGDAFSVREVFDDLGLDYDLTDTKTQDVIADAFMAEAQRAFWHEVERTARHHLGFPGGVMNCWIALQSAGSIVSVPVGDSRSMASLESHGWVVVRIFRASLPWDAGQVLVSCTSGHKEGS